MAGRIRQEDVDAVRERTDLVKVVGGYLQLKKAGRDSMVGICPFHPEKTASFSVSPAKQVYYCFGCGEGGNVFRFVERLENLTFAETVERLAKEAGITLRYEGESAADRRAQSMRSEVHRAVADAARWYHRTLLEGREGADARGYLERRGITAESVERFGVGYAPAYPDFLLRRMSKSFSVDLMVEAGLATKDAAGNVRDRFRGRVMFPIHDLTGNAVGFGGRLLEGPHAPPDAPKYVNSQDSPLYHKGSLLYNLHRAKAEVTRTGRAWMVEGYTDVIALDQAGVQAVVATCGTALGEDHVRLLARFTDRLVLAFDSDEAGARAAERAFQFHERYPLDVSVLVLPQGQDPADFALAQGEGAGEAFTALESDAVPLVVYMLERTLSGGPQDDVEAQTRAVQDGVAVLARLDDPVRRERYARILADRVGVRVESVLLELQRHDGRAGATPGSSAPPAPRLGARRRPQEKVEWEVLKLAVQTPELCGERLEGLDPTQFAKATHRKVAELLREIPRGGGAAAMVSLAQARSEQLGREVAALAVEPLESGGEPTAEYADRLFLRFEEFRLDHQIEEVRRELQRINPLKAPEQHDALFDQLARLAGAKRRVRELQEAPHPVEVADRAVSGA
jgi:DNA primase